MAEASYTSTITAVPAVPVLVTPLNVEAVGPCNAMEDSGPPSRERDDVGRVKARMDRALNHQGERGT